MLNYSGTCSGAPADHFVTSGSPGSTPEETETEEVTEVEGELKNGLQKLQKLKEVFKVFKQKKNEQGSMPEPASPEASTRAGP